MASYDEKAPLPLEKGAVPSSTTRTFLNPPEKKTCLGKRTHSDSEGTFSDSSGRPCKLEINVSTTTSDRISSQQRDGSESPNSLSQIPTQISNWTDHHFPHLRIEEVTEVFAPYVIFNSFSDFLENQKSKRSKIHAIYSEPSPKRQLYVQCYNYVMDTVLDLEYDHIDHIPMRRVDELYTKTKSLEKSQLHDWIRGHIATGTENIGLSKKEREMRSELKEKCISICDRLNLFLLQLLYMVNRKKASESEDLIEGMFQELFMRFARIFGLEIFCDPNIARFTLEVEGKNVKSRPSGLILNPSHKDHKNPVLAVVEVKKSYSKEEDLESAHIDYKLKGQHVGEMLSVLPSSLFGPSGIYGFIVQATEVTVVAFAAEDNYLENLRTGDLPKKQCATVQYSEKCNILSKKGRLDLVNTFLDMTTLMEYL